MPENKRTKMLAIQTRMDPSDAAGSLQKQIDDVESKGHYVMQYIPLNAYDGILLAHDYPDKKNWDADGDGIDDRKQKKTPPANPDGSPQAPVTDAPVTREETADTGIPAVDAPDTTAPESVKPAPSKSKGKRK